MYRKHGFLPALAAAMLLAACADNDPLGVDGTPAAGPEIRAAPAAPQRAVAPVGAKWRIFTWEEPTEYLDAAPGWEVSTRFSSTKSGTVNALWFWRAPGESGTNTGRLWTDDGRPLASADFPSGQSGWVYVPLQTPVAIAANTYYRVSVNTNTKQAKWPTGFHSIGSAGSGPISATGSHYGQPMGSMPDNGSGSIFFVDVEFEEDVPLPNLYVGNMFLGRDYWGNQIVTVHVCNNGAASAGPTTTRVKHWWSPGGPWYLQWDSSVPTQAIGAGTCTALNLSTNTPAGNNLWEAWADATDVVYESNEYDNYRSISGLF